MSYDSYQIFAMTYATKDAAMEDFIAVEALYAFGAAIDTYDAVVLHKQDGKVGIVRKREQAEHTRGWEGLGLGLAAGACMALFPAVTLAGGLLAGGTIGAVAGIISGHVVAGISRSDLKDIGQSLDEGQYGLLVVAATDMAARVRDVARQAVRVEEKELKADYKAIRKELDQAYAAMA